MLRALFLSLILASFSPLSVGAEEIQSNLPAGYYIYLGSHPGQDSPKAFTIKFDGHGEWHQQPIRVAPATTVTPMTATALKRGEPAPKQATPTAAANVNWDSYSWPLIAWKPHPITTIPDGIAVLETKFDGDLMTNYGGRTKYKIRLFKVDKAKMQHSLRVQLLDANGFKIVEFRVPRDSFHPVPGTSLLEAFDEFRCSHKEYSEARDYLVE